MFQGNSVLLVKNKKGRFSFPKGKKERKDLTIYECARREFLEETGMFGFSYVMNRNSIEHFNPLKKKIVYYYACRMEIKFDYFEICLCDPDNDIVESNFYDLHDVALNRMISEEFMSILLEAQSRLANNNCEFRDSFMSREFEMKLSTIK